MNSGKRGDHLGTKAFGILCALLGGMCLVNIPSLYKSEVDFHSKAIRATGTVVKTRVEIRHSGGASSTVFPEYISTVKFQTNQAESVEFTTSSACSSRRDCENKTVSVLYDPSHPKDAIVDSGSTPEGKFRTGMVLSAVFLLLGIAAILQRFLG